MDNLTFAAAFADRAHRGQVRKGGDKPYITHPREVAALVEQHYPEASEDLRIAAWLHDVVEDTPIPVATIRVLFGPRVASLVWDVTNTRPDYALERAQPDALRLKAADLLANISDTQHDIESGQFVWPRFATGRGKVNAWDRQTAVIEQRLQTGRADAPKTDRDLVERVRAKVEVMRGLATIVTDAERAAMAEYALPR